jgi:hypothetical protein
VAVQDLYESDVMKAVRRSGDNPLPEQWKDFEKNTGLAFADIPSALIIFLPGGDERAGSPGPIEPIAVLTTARAYSRDRIQQAIAPDWKEEQVQGKTYFAGNNGEAVSFINNRTLVMGKVPGLERYLSQRGSASLQGPLGPALKLAARSHTLAAGFRMPETLSQEMHRQPLPAPYAFVKPLLDVESGSLVVDLNGQLEARTRMRFPDEAVATEAHEATKAGLHILR